MRLEELLISDLQVKRLLSRMPEEIKSRCSVKKFLTGSTVVKKEECVRFVYILIKGEVKVINEFENGSIYSFASVFPINFIGELEILAGEMENAVTIKAAAECIMIKLTAEDFIKWIRVDHDTLMLVARVLAKKLYPASYENGNVLFSSGISKVRSYIIKYYRKKAEIGGMLVIHENRQQIADELCISVKTINRSIKKLKEEGMVAVKKGKICISKEQFSLLQAESKKTGS